MSCRGEALPSATIRVHRSAYELVSGATVAGTARRVGYRSTGAYIDAFRAATGVTPGKGLASPAQSPAPTSRDHPGR